MTTSTSTSVKPARSARVRTAMSRFMIEDSSEVMTTSAGDDRAVDDGAGISSHRHPRRTSSDRGPDS